MNRQLNNNDFEDIRDLPAWDAMLKLMTWSQLGDISGKKILDFGSGTGVNASHYAAENEVVAVEPSSEEVSRRFVRHSYRQICGGVSALECFHDESFDVILCHNVFEYVEQEERLAILDEFQRILKKDGFLSVIKHNRQGRIMQSVVLLNDFEAADRLLQGENSFSQRYGEIRYYEDEEIEKWCQGLQVCSNRGMRTFFDLQQNQECHRDRTWQEKMVAMELKVQEEEDYRKIAFFHHLVLKKTQ